MGAETKQTMELPVPPDQAKALILQAMMHLPKFDKVDEDDTLGLIRWRKGWGWSNPVTVEVFLKPGGAGTVVELKASILALVDPFGFTKITVQRFDAAVQGTLAGETPQVPDDNRGVMLFVGTFGLMLVGGCGCSGLLILLGVISEL